MSHTDHQQLRLYPAVKAEPTPRSMYIVAALLSIAMVPLLWLPLSMALLAFAALGLTLLSVAAAAARYQRQFLDLTKFQGVQVPDPERMPILLAAE